MSRPKRCPSCQWPMEVREVCTGCGNVPKACRCPRSKAVPSAPEAGVKP